MSVHIYIFMFKTIGTRFMGIHASYKTLSPPSHCPRRPFPHTAPHAPAVHHAVVREHADRTSTEPLVTDCTMPVLVNDHPSVEPTRYLPSMLVRLVVNTKQHCCLDCHLLHASQPRNNAFLVEKGIGVADPTKEVRLQVLDGQCWRDQV